MKGPFDFLLLEKGSYDSRKVDRYEGKDVVVSTVRVTDTPFPYETAVRHPDYNDDDIIVVDNYMTKGEAQVGHNKWVAIMTADILPATLVDTSQAASAKLLDLFTGKANKPNWRIFPKMRR